MTLSKWTVGAALTGAVLYVAILHRFETYSQRNNMAESQVFLFAGAMVIAGFGLALAAVKEEWAVAKWMVAGVLVAHAVAIAVDLQADPTNHNLLPFEMVMFALLAAPAFVGAGAVRLFRRVR